MDCLFCKKKLSEWAIAGGTIYECVATNVLKPLGGCASKIYFNNGTKRVVRYELFKKFKGHVYFIEGSLRSNKTIIYINDKIEPSLIYDLPVQYITLKNYNKKLTPLVRRASKLLAFI